MIIGGRIMNEKTKKKLSKVGKALPFIIGGIALALGFALTIKDCSAKGVKAEGFEDMPSSLDIVNSEPLYSADTSNVLMNGGNPITTYMTVNLIKEGDHYEYNKLSLNTVCWNNSSLYSNVSYDFYFPSGFSIDENYYLFFWLYTQNKDNAVKTYLEVRLTDYDVVRNWNNQQNDVFKNTTNYGYDLTTQYYWVFLDTGAYNTVCLYQIEGQRLQGMVNSYNNGYWAGVSAGVSNVKDNPYQYNLWRDADMDANYQKGYQAGLDAATGNTIPNIIMTIFRAPTTILEGVFDFELFGVNMLNLVKLLLTVGVVVWIISVFKKG